MKERKFCGLNWYQMDELLSCICEIEDRIDLTEDEEQAFDIAIQCVAQVMNRMNDDNPIDWDE